MTNILKGTVYLEETQLKASYLKKISVLNKFIARNLIMQTVSFKKKMYSINDKSPSIPNGTQKFVLHFSN